MTSELKPVKATKSPQLYCFVDVETFDREEKTIERDGIVIGDAKLTGLRLGVAKCVRRENGRITREKVCRFFDARSFWDWLAGRLHQRMPLWLFTHNVGFDLTNLGFWELLENGEYRIRDDDQTTFKTESGYEVNKGFKGIFVYEDPPTFGVFKHRDGGTLKVCDTVNYFAKSLRKIGQSVGFHKMDIDFAKADDNELMIYCERDVDVLAKLVLGVVDWIEENDLGGFRFTAPSLSMHAYRRRFMREKIILHHCQPVKELEHRSYYGGRLECLKIGEFRERCYELDVKSQYPAMMRNNRFPRELIASSFTHPDVELTPDALRLNHIADVTLSVGSDGFPYRCKMGTIYPVGEYRTTLAGPELLRARDSGAIRTIHDWSCYALGDLFSEFIDFFWERRLEYLQEGDKLGSDLCKLIMNSHYGKYAQKTPEWGDTTRSDDHESFTEWYEFDWVTKQLTAYRKVGNLVQRKIPRRPDPKAFPAISAYVTAYGRENIRSIARIAGWENCYYLVTDAVYVNETGRDNIQKAGLIRENELGYLEEGAVGEFSKFETLHHYQVGTKRKYGSRKGYSTLWCSDCQKWVEVDKGKCPKCKTELSALKVKETKFQGLKSILKGDTLSGVWITPQVKEFSLEYKRGHVEPDGTVRPLNLSIPVDLALTEGNSQ